MNAWDSAIINARRIALKDMIIPKRIGDWSISKDLKAGKLIFKRRRSKMTTRKNTNYLQYDTRTVTK